MTAYELADALQETEPYYSTDYKLFDNAANILRQQADRIAELEKDLVLKTRDRDVFCNFTLAYEKRIEELEKLEQDFIRVIKQTNPNKPQTKPLSNDEIREIGDDCVLKNNGILNWIEFARAILRKAQEK